MRELRFRVWDNKENKYLDPEEIAIDNLGNVFIFEGYQKEDNEVWNARVLDKTDARFVIEQSTNLKDKNGKEIHEGDIVSRYNGNLKGVVKQTKDGQWAIYWDNIPDGYYVLFKYSNLSEVVGNINENPELLEK